MSTTQRSANGWRSELRWAGQGSGVDWTARLSEGGPDGFSARLDGAAGTFVLGGLTWLAPVESPGWANAGSERNGRRAPAPSATSSETGIAWAGATGPLRAVVAGGRARTGAAAGRMELRLGGLEAGWVSASDRGVAFAAFQRRAGATRWRADAVHGAALSVQRLGFGGGRAGEGFVLETRREEGVRAWRARAGARVASQRSVASAEVEAGFREARSVSKFVISLARFHENASVRFDARAVTGGRLRTRLEASPHPGWEVGADWIAGRLSSVDLGWELRRLRGRVQLPDQGPTRARVTFGPFVTRLRRLRVSADFRSGRSTDLVIEWRSG